MKDDVASDDSSSDDSSDGDSSDDDDSESMGAATAASPPRPPRPLPRPALHLGPAELLLLAIHPAVLGGDGAGAGQAGAAGEAAAGGDDPTAAGRGRKSSNDNNNITSMRGHCNLPQPQPAPPPHRRRSHPPPRLTHLFLELPFKPHGRDAAATTTALCVLLAALRGAVPGLAAGGVRSGSSGSGVASTAGAQLEVLGVCFSPGEYLAVVAQGGSERLGPLVPLWGQVVGGLAELMLSRPSLRELHLSCPPGLLTPAHVERLQRAAADPGPRRARRLAVLMGG
ncbi:hypothetical protein Agub_g1385, partial [Astrephomene gubernaculifera]